MKLYNPFQRKLTPLVLITVISLFLALGCAGVTKPGPQSELPKTSGQASAGYLPKADLPDCLSLLPPPPAPGSAAFIADEETYRVTRALRNTPRWALAARDVDLAFPGAPDIFSCAVDIPITEDVVPRLHGLMYKSLIDAALATRAPKDHYRRVRPFVVNKDATCSPEHEPRLMKSGSYPSGHSSIGWTWALILTEIAPDRTNAILSRGFAFGESRVVCGAHWQSDVTAGRIVASGLVARLHADPQFRADLEAARNEIATTRAKGLKPARDCREEAAAMAYGPPHAR
jgi:acid phosphatase (class A)